MGSQRVRHDLVTDLIWSERVRHDWVAFIHPRFVIVFFQGVSFSFVATVTIHSDFGAQENKDCHCFHFFPIWNCSTLATWWQELADWKRPWCWERLAAGGEGDDRGWDGWVVSPTQWTWVCLNSRSWWWTGRPGVLWSMRSQSIRHDWATELKESNCQRKNTWRENKTF